MAKEYFTPIVIPDDPYDDTTFNGNREAVTKNALRDKIHAMETEMDFAELQFSVVTPPSTPAADLITVYLAGSGTTPNRTLEWRMKNEAGEELILSSLIV